MGEPVAEHMALVRKRTDVLAALEGDPLDPRAIEAQTDASRSTINRALRSLEDAGLVEARGGEYGLTAVGRLGLEHYRRYRRQWADLLAARPLLASLPDAETIPIAAVAGGETVLPPDEAPYQPAQHLQAAIAAADRYRGVLPALEDPRQLRLLYEHVVTDGQPATLVVSERLHDSLTEQFPRRLAAMAETDDFELAVGEVPAFGLVLTETDGETAVSLVFFGETGGVSGVLHNDTDRAVAWAETVYEQVRTAATPATEALRQSTDGGYTDAAAPTASLPPSDAMTTLEREGFVRLSRAYFREQPVAAPTAAWRAGLALAEVHTGYAIDRYPTPVADGATLPSDAAAADDESGSDSDSGSGSPPEAPSPPDTAPAANTAAGSDRQSLTDCLLDELTDGETCVLTGPPGSGKSTTAKRVACAWYDRDLGPVFYREQGRGAPFRSSSALLAALEAADDGRALVVVEDAVRPEAAPIFEAIARLDDLDRPVSVLLDAREREWRDPDTRPAAVGLTFSVTSMPGLSTADYERVIDQFEQTVGVSVDVDPERLRTRLHDASAVPAAPNELVVLVHRLASYAAALDGRAVDSHASTDRAGSESEPPDATDEAATDRTTLETAVARVYDAVSDHGDRAVDVAMTAALLTAAGVGVTPAYLRAAAGSGSDPDAEIAAIVDAATDALDGRLLFGRVDDDPAASYRTAHEAWAVQFLEHLLETEAAAAVRDRVRRCMAAVLALADAADAAGVPDAVAAEPGAWADATVAALYRLGRDRAALVALFDGEDGPTITPPAAARSVTTTDCRLWLGRMLLHRGDNERALAVFDAIDVTETAPDAEPTEATPPVDPHAHSTMTAAAGDDEIERLLGLSEAAAAQSEYETATDAAQRCLERARAAGDRSGVARSLVRLADVASDRDDYETATDRLETALETFRDLGDRRRVARTLDDIGDVCRLQGRYEAAETRFQTALEIFREIGDRRGQAYCLCSLGVVAHGRGRFTDARELYRRSLELVTVIGDRAQAAVLYNNLGLIARNRGEYERASEHLERALAAHRAVGHRRQAAGTLDNLGILAEVRGDYDRAQTYYEESLAAARAVGARRSEASALDNLGGLLSERGEHERARDHVERALSINREIGDRRSEANCLGRLADIARRTGAYDRARDRAREARSIHATLDNRAGEAYCLKSLGTTLYEQGAHDRARAYCEWALELLQAVDEESEQLGDVHLTLGRIAHHRGAHERAREHLTAAVTAYESAGALRDAVVARERLVAVERAADRPAAARDHCQQGLERLAELEFAVPETREALESHRQALDDAAAT